MRLKNLFEYEDLLEAIKSSAETFDELVSSGEYELNKPFGQQEWFTLNSKDKINKLKTNKFYKICKEHLISFKVDIMNYIKDNPLVDKKSINGIESKIFSPTTGNYSLSIYINFMTVDGKRLIIRISDHKDLNVNHKENTYYIKLGRYLSPTIKKNIDDFIDKQCGVEPNNKKVDKKPLEVVVKKKILKK